MSLNAFMHPRNIYKTPPDFKQLVENYPDIRQYMTTDLAGKTRFNFSNPDALIVLTRTLLLRDFQLEVTIPHDRLVPTLPNRLNYILWLEDILQQAVRLPEEETPRGLDVGTGSCAIYSLLAARRGWSMVGTETDPEALASARANVAANQLQEQIQVLSADDTLLTGLVQAAGDFHFTLCNPPFYDSEDPEEGVEARARRPPPPGPGTGLAEEVSCPGGERAFVGRMITESATLRDRCRVFSTMLGHKSSVRPMKRATYEAGACEAITTELCQGNTKRWAVAWTFRTDIHLKQVTAMKQVKKRVPLQCIIPHNMADVAYNVPSVKQLVVAWLEELQMTVEPGNCNKHYASYKVAAMEDTWTHVRRRRRAQQRALSSPSPPGTGADTTSDLEPSPCSADLGSPEGSAAPEVASPGADAALKRAHTDSGHPAAKRPCLDSQLNAVTLQDDSAATRQGDTTPKQKPALVFTLFVQKKWPDILLQLSLLAGELDIDGMNGVLTYLRNQMEKRTQVMSRAGGRSGRPATGTSEGRSSVDTVAAPTLGSGNARLAEGIGRMVGYVRDKMRSKISLDPAVTRSAETRTATEGAGNEAGTELANTAEDTEPAAAGELKAASEASADHSRQ